MNKEECIIEINKINEFLKNSLWMDFEMCKMNEGEVIFSGCLDEIDDESIRISFKQPYMVSSLMSFTYEGGENFIMMLTDDEFIATNIKYHVEKGNYIFKIDLDGFDDGFMIIAKEVECQILARSNN